MLSTIVLNVVMLSVELNLMPLCQESSYCGIMLSVIIHSVIILSSIILSDIMLSDVMLSLIILSVIVLSVTMQCHYSERYYV